MTREHIKKDLVITKYVSVSTSHMSYSLLLCAWNSPGKNIGVSCHFLFQGVFPTMVLNLSLLHYRQIFCHLSH